MTRVSEFIYLVIFGKYKDSIKECIPEQDFNHVCGAMRGVVWPQCCLSDQWGDHPTRAASEYRL